MEFTLYLKSLVEEKPDLEGVDWNSVIGASNEDIEKLESESLVVFPQDYKTLLKVMGKDCGGFLKGVAGVGGHADVRSLLLVEEERKVFPEDFPIPPWFTIIAGETGICLVMNAESNAIHYFYDGVGENYANNLRGFLSKIVHEKT